MCCCCSVLACLFLEPHTGVEHCPIIVLSCFRARTSGWKGPFYLERPFEGPHALLDRHQRQCKMAGWDVHRLEMSIQLLSSPLIFRLGLWKLESEYEVGQTFRVRFSSCRSSIIKKGDPARESGLSQKIVSGWPRVSGE